MKIIGRELILKEGEDNEEWILWSWRINEKVRGDERDKLLNENIKKNIKFK